MLRRRWTSRRERPFGEQQVVDRKETEAGVHEPGNDEARDSMERANAQRAMLRIANPQDRSRHSWRRGRARYFDEFRLLKLRFMLFAQLLQPPAHLLQLGLVFGLALRPDFQLQIPARAFEQVVGLL